MDLLPAVVLGKVVKTQTKLLFWEDKQALDTSLLDASALRSITTVYIRMFVCLCKFNRWGYFFNQAVLPVENDVQSLAGLLPKKFSSICRTVEPNGLILNTLGRRGSNDFAAVEMYDGILYVVINVGDGVHHIQASETQLNDGQPHAVSLSRLTTNSNSIVF